MILEHIVSNNPTTEALRLEARDDFKEINGDIAAEQLTELSGEFIQYIEKLSEKVIELSDNK